MSEKKDGYVTCPRCNGTKLVLTEWNGSSEVDTCPKCLGKGELDWIEMVVGKKKKGIKLYLKGRRIKFKTPTSGIEPLFKTIVNRRIKGDNS